MRLFIKVLVVCLFFISSIGYADTMFIKSNKVKVFEEPKLASAVVIELDKGQQVEIVAIKGLWYQIKTGNKVGWVSKYLLSKEEVNSKPDRQKLRSINLKQNARKRASSFSTAAAARGLSAGQITGDIKDDIKAVKKMEETEVKEDEVKSFIREGDLVDY